LDYSSRSGHSRRGSAIQAAQQGIEWVVITAFLALAVSLTAPGDAPARALVAGVEVPPPRKVKNVVAPFPDIARRAFPPLEGIVLLEVTLDELGRPDHIVVRKGVPVLDFAAIEAVRQWEYEPTLVEGAPRRVILKAVVEFFLSPKARSSYLVDLVGATKEDVGLRLYAMQALLADTRDRKATRKAFEKAVRDRNEAVAQTARAGLEQLAPE
jgi:TonB family protein